MEQQNNQYHSDIQNKLENGYIFDYRKYISQGFEFMKLNFMHLLTFSIFYFFSSLLFVGLGGQITLFFQLILLPVITAGFYYVIRKRDLGLKPDFHDYFKGFSRILSLFVGNILQSIFISMTFGYLLFWIIKQLPDKNAMEMFQINPTMEMVFKFTIFPGLYLLVASLFMIPFIIFRKMTFLHAMESSRLLITKQFFQVLLFLIIIVAIPIGGILIFGQILILILGQIGAIIGIFTILLIAFPFSYSCFYFAFKDLMPIQDEYNRQEQDF